MSDSAKKIQVAFVRAGSAQGFDPRPYIRVQSDSLESIGVGVSSFYLEGGNPLKYLRAVAPLRRFLQDNRFDLVHAHYGYCGVVALMARRNEPLVVSFMGTDLYGGVGSGGGISLQGRLNIRMARYLAMKSAGIIVKSERMLPFIPRSCHRKTIVVPNGVDLQKMSPLPQDEARRLLGLPVGKQVVLFLGDKSDPRKNFRLFQDTCDRIRHKDVHIAAPYPVTHAQVVQYLSAADVMVLTSTHEGSPNIVKEAMACNLPVVSVDVGDVAERLRSVTNSVVCPYDANALATAVDSVLASKSRSNGRDILVEEGLDTISIANRILEFYKAVLAGSELTRDTFTGRRLPHKNAVAVENHQQA